MIQVVLVSEDPAILGAWRAAFADEPGVEIAATGLARQRADAWVVSAGPDGSLGLEGQRVVEALGDGLRSRVRSAVAGLPGGALPLGRSVCVGSGRQDPAFVIVTGAVRSREPEEVVLCTSAALHAVHQHNESGGAFVGSVALPDLGPDGLTEAERADLMWTAYDLFRIAELPSYEALRGAVAKLFASGTTEGLRRRLPGVRFESDFKKTVPDNAAFEAQLRKRLGPKRDDE